MNTDKFKKTAFFIIGIAAVLSFSAILVNKNLKDPKLFGPEIKFDTSEQHFGDVPQGPKLEGTYEFTNTGKNVLEIQNVTTSCGCTGAIVDGKKDYQPGEQGKIKFTFNTEGRLGHNEKTITVFSNDMKHPTETLKFDCNIVAQK
jgi:Protein of unknown function (DUF1573)